MSDAVRPVSHKFKPAIASRKFAKPQLAAKFRLSRIYRPSRKIRLSRRKKSGLTAASVILRDVMSFTVFQQMQFKVAFTAFDCVRGSGSAYFMDVSAAFQLHADIAGQTHLFNQLRHHLRTVLF